MVDRETREKRYREEELILGLWEGLLMAVVKVTVFGRNGGVKYP